MAFPEDLMYDTVQVRPYAGEGGYGPIYGEVFDEACSIEFGCKSITDAKGNRVVSSLSGIFRAECAIKANDVVVYENGLYRAVVVAPMRMGPDVHHVEIDFVSVAG